MKQYRKTFWGAIIFFILINTRFFVEGFLLLLAMLYTLGLFVYFLVILIQFIYHLAISVKDKFRDRQRSVLVAVLALIIGVTLWKPFGLINYNTLFGKPVLSANHIGSANCTMYLRLYPNKVYEYTDICFGVSTKLGKYDLKGDTIFFRSPLFNWDDRFYDYAIISDTACRYFNESIGSLKLHYTKDSIIREACIIENDIFK